MLNYCTIDPFLVTMARTPTIPSSGNNIQISTTSEPAPSSTVPRQVGHSSIRYFLKRVASRHILCDFFLGVSGSGTCKYRKYFEDIVFAGENHFAVYWREFSLARHFERLKTDFTNFRDKDRLAKICPDVCPKSSAGADDWGNWAMKMGYLLAGCAADDITIIIAHHKTVEMLNALLNHFKCALTPETSAYIEKYRRNCVTVENQAEASGLKLSGNLEVLENSWFLLSSVERFDRRINLSIGLNLAGIPVTEFLKLLNPIRQCFPHVYAIQSSKPPNKTLALWKQNNFNINIITTDSLPKEHKGLWHDRFIVFASHPREQGMRSPHRFVALVFSAPFEQIFYVPEQHFMRHNTFYLRQGTCLLRCDSDCSNTPGSHENIASFLANTSATLPPLSEP